MELKEGYKKTDWGEIPNDWEVVTLAALTEKNRPISYGIVQTGENVINGVRCVRVVDIIDGFVNTTNLITTSREISESYKRTILKEGDLVIALRGKVGEIAYIDQSLEGANLTRGVAVIGTNKSYYSQFVKQQLNSKHQKHIFENNLNGSALKELALSVLRKILIAAPNNLTEQTAIATALSDADALIVSIEKLIAKKRLIKKGAMQKLLSPKEGWEVKKLKEVSNIDKGEQLNRAILSNDEKYPVINGGVLPSGYTSNWNQESNTITISEGGNSCGFVNIIKTKFWQGGHCYSIETNQNKEFLYHLLKSKELDIMNLRVGSGLPNIQRNRLVDFELCFPNDDNQSRIATILSDMDTEIEGLETKLAKYKQIKQGMMQNLLTGKIRLV